jgi:hypothetical protein
MVRRRIDFNRPMLLAALPMLGLRLVAGAWGHHYLAPVAACLAAAAWPRQRGQELPVRVMFASLLLLAATSGGTLLGLADHALHGDTGILEPGQAARLEAIGEARALLLAQPRGKALVEGNLFPLLATRPDLYTLGGTQGSAGNVYRFVLVEQPPRGDAWPLGGDQLRERIARWRQSPDCRVLRDDASVFFAEGQFGD